MRIPYYDSDDGNFENYKQLNDFMPNKCIRMLICGPSGSGKMNTLMHMIYNVLYYDKIYLYAKNLEQSKYQSLLKVFELISKDIGSDIIEASNDQIIPVTDDNQKLVIFDKLISFKRETKSH